MPKDVPVFCGWTHAILLSPEGSGWKGGGCCGGGGCGGGGGGGGGGCSGGGGGGGSAAAAWAASIVDGPSPVAMAGVVGGSTLDRGHFWG